MTNQLTPSENRSLTEALSSLYATVLIAGQKRRGRFARTRRVSQGYQDVTGQLPKVEQLELGLVPVDE